MPAASVPGHEPPSYVCPFCAIVAGRGDPPFTVQDDVVDRTAVTTAWIGSRWWERNPGHVIVVPNEHVENMYALRQELAGAIHETARRIALALRRAYGCEGISTRQHNEPAGYQEIWHYHLHVFPRYEGDDLYGASCRTTTPAERRPYAERLRAELGAAPESTTVSDTDLRQGGGVPTLCRSIHTLSNGRCCLYR